MLKQLGILIIGALLLALLAAPAFGAVPGPSVVVHFDNGKAYLNDADKDKLHRLFKAYDVRKSGRVFVLGYTDSQGNRQYNYSLSRKRAKSVRREIIDSFGINA
ncbi:MAG: OmpA family protein, partial [Desulfobacteraceae bacterium]